MLRILTIHDLAIVDRLEIDFSDGTTVLTGETGAGKSILVDALGLALGERASTGLIRPGCERADVGATFDIGNCEHAHEWLGERDLAAGDECILRRVLGRDGRSRAFVNARPVPVSALREIGDLVVDIHGQHAHQSLLHRAVQRRLLDEFGGHAEHLTGLGALHQRWVALNASLKALSGPASERDAHLDLLRYQHRELEALDLRAGEPERLAQDYERLSHIDELISACQGVMQTLDGESGATVLGDVHGCCNALRSAGAHDAALTAVCALIDDAGIALREAVNDLRAYADRLEPDPQALQTIDDRIAAIHAVARKHRARPDDLIGLGQRIGEEIARIEDSESRVRTLNADIAQIESAYAEAAGKLHRRRVEASHKLAAEITRNIDRLGLPGARLRIAVERDAGPGLSPEGSDRVEIAVSTNPGQPLQPLSRVASGGELSRISLALQVVTAQGTGVPTLIFDEVDAGIGGRVAEIVGQQLRALGERRQVLCVTHLPQVACQAHHHLQISKESTATSTRARLQPLSGNGRVEELARMLGGIDITEQTIAHAREMLDAGKWTRS